MKRRKTQRGGLAVRIGLCAAGLLLVTQLITRVSAASAASEPKRGFEVGQQYPDVLLPALDGSGTLSISSFRGRKIILFQFASW